MSRLNDGSATMIVSSRSPQGYEVVMAGETRRETADFDGLTLIRKVLAE